MLSEQQIKNLRAFVARVVPDDDGLPGAVAVGVDMHLRAMLVRDLKADVPVYRAVLDALGEDFASLGAAQQDERMQVLEKSTEHRRGFQRMVEQVQEGFYVSPVAWRLIGWEVTG